MEDLTAKIRRFLPQVIPALSRGFNSVEDGEGCPVGRCYEDGTSWVVPYGQKFDGKGPNDEWTSGSIETLYGTCRPWPMRDIKTINGEAVYWIDAVPTILRHVAGDCAAGFTIREDMTLKACFVARAGDYYAHGATLREAMEEAREKYEGGLPEEESIRRFMETYPTLDTVAACRDLFEWHHTLTGSCKMGRTEFVNARGIDVEHDTMSVANFIRLTENAYGGETIKKMKEIYETQKNTRTMKMPKNKVKATPNT